MYKSGILFAIVMVVMAAGIALFSPLCVPCVAIFVGLGAGYLTGIFDKPLEKNTATKNGAIAGAIAGVGSLVGHLIGGVINAVMLGPEGAAQFARQLGLPSDGSPVGFYAGVFGGACCFGLLEIALMAGLAALGGILWFNMSGPKQTPPPSPAGI